MEQMENQRVRLSKRLIKESLTGLLKEADVHKISIRTLCEQAGINRSTFYKYYGSQYDVLEEMENDLISSICGTLREGDSDGESLTKICLYLENNLDTVQVLIGSNVDLDFPRKLFNLPQIKEMLATRLPGQLDRESQEYFYQFVVNGCYCMIRQWLANETRMPPREIADLMISAVNRVCMI